MVPNLQQSVLLYTVDHHSLLYIYKLILHKSLFSITKPAHPEKAYFTYSRTLQISTYCTWLLEYTLTCRNFAESTDNFHVSKIRSDFLHSFSQRGFDRSLFRLNVPSRKGYLPLQGVTNNNDQDTILLMEASLKNNDRRAMWKKS